MLGERIGEGKVAEVFAYGADVVKLYRDGGKEQAFREAAHLALLEARGVPAPQVICAGRFEGRWGLVMTRAGGTSLGQFAMEAPENFTPAMTEFAQLHRRLHAVSGRGMPPLKGRLAIAISGAPGLSEAMQGELQARLADLPDGEALVHGDFHPFNVMGRGADAVVVDWLDAASGPIEADMCRTWLLLSSLSEAAADAYLEAYAATGSSGPSRQMVMAWLPVLAGARLAENVPDDAPRLLHLAAGSKTG